MQPRQLIHCTHPFVGSLERRALLRRLVSGNRHVIGEFSRF